MPELRAIDAKRIHEPWTIDVGGRPLDYPDPIVDHGDERREALRRLDVLRR
jgi:deoxyribodipyrimidine photo-lyase